MTSPPDPRLLDRAGRPGRIRGIGLDLWARGVRDRPRAGPIWSAGLRAARALHSGERRLVGDLLVAMVRAERGAAELVGPAPEALWDLCLARLRGEPTGLEALGGGPRDALRLRHGWPDLLADHVLAELGPEEALAFAAASDRRAPVCLRPNRGSAEALAAALAAEGVATAPGRVPGSLRVVGGRRAEQTDAFRSGAFELQDEGSQRLGALVGPEPARVLDLCAGAGGKSLQLAARGHRVTACDVRPHALEELGRRAARAGLPVARTLAPEGQFDVVLVDAPCSGSGVLRRHPEHRWRYTEARLADLVATQRALLATAWRRVRPGGRVVYGTCAVGRAEDEEVLAGGVGLRTWPHRDDCDGFYGVSVS